MALVPLAFAVFASGASAKKLTLGAANATAAQASGFYCNAGFDWVQRTVASSTPTYTVPGRGTITSWSTSAFQTGAAALKIWAPTSNPQQFTPVAESSSETVTGDNTLHKFKTSIPVQKGDVLGMAITGTGISCFYFAPYALPGDIAAYTFGDPTSGTATFTDYAPPSRVNVSAKFAPDCIVPKLKGKSLSKAKKALKKANCTLGKVTKKASSKKPGTVLKQKPGPGKDLKYHAKVSVTVAKK